MIQKQPIDVRFGAGLLQKSDPKQVSLGNFLQLENSVFDSGGRLTKRNGYADLTQLPALAGSSILSTFQDSLISVGTTLQAYSASSKTWIQMGELTPLSLNVFPVARPNAKIAQCDSAVAASPLTGGLGLACTVFTTGSGYYYQITDATTGATVIPAATIPTTATVNGVPKVFIVGTHFIVVYSATASGTERLQFIAISLTNPANITAAADITTTYTANATTAWDGVVANNSLYIAYNASTMGGAVKITFIDSTLIQHGTVTFASEHGSVFGLSADTTGSSPVIYVTYWNSTPLGRVLAVSAGLVTILTPTTFDSTDTIGNLAPYAANGQVQILYEIIGTYGYDSSLPNNSVGSVVVTVTGSVATPTSLLGVGLASKAFLFEGAPTVMLLYSGLYENGYFLANALTARIVCKIAYGNAVFSASTGQGYLKTGLPGAWIVGDSTYVGYLQADSIQPVNKTQGQSTTGVYLQAGASIAEFSTSDVPTTIELGGTLLIAAGLVSLYDGSEVVEQGFSLWPDEVETSTATTGGSLVAQTYFYQATYEWTDAQGYLHRSAPSVPVEQVVPSGTSTNANTIYVPTLRLTQKVGVRIVLYRWSTEQQTYYEAATINNNPAANYVTFVDILADSSIIGNAILYTTGGVLEDIGAPPCNVMTIYRSRAMMLDAEDQNTIWFSKIVEEGTPVEMTDLQTIYCSPTIGSQGSTGPVTSLFAMDDKLVMFKKDGSYYESGQGPDATGANSDYTDPIYITSSVGCANPQSLVLIPTGQTPGGIMFQSDKGIWLLGRDLSTSYIGFPVDGYNSLINTSAISIPGTNQIRISTDGGPTLMYDYFYNQWGTFSTEVQSSCVVQGVHTTLDAYGRIRQESQGLYLDGSAPVLISFTTGWGNLAGLQAYQRAYFLLLEGTYFSPFVLNVGLSYDYVPTIIQNVTVLPQAPNTPFGSDPTFGAGYSFGGTNKGQFKPRIFLTQQRCQAFQVSVQEQYDSSYGIPAGQGFNLSGMTAIVGIKRGFRTNSAATSFG